MSDGPPPSKRSKWETSDDADELELLAAEARAKAAAKASRERVKAAQREREREAAAAAAAKAAQTAYTSSASASNTPLRASRRDTSAAPSASSSTATLTASFPSSANSKRRRPPFGMPSRHLYPLIAGCRSVSTYERLNHIEEGSYGVVFRARHRETGDIVALKKLKMEKERNGFPITSLREIRTIMKCRHDNVVRVREIVVGETLTQIFIVMDFIEHDLKTLLTTMRTPFLASEIKTLLHQLLSAMSLLHRNWIMHRDLKTSNLLMNNRGTLKLADFGLARFYGEPKRAGEMTDLVVTLWYRAPELLLGAPSYDTAIDMWSVGCIFAEFILREPLLPGKNEADQIAKIFKLLGQPTSASWPDYPRLPGARSLSTLSPAATTAQPYSTLRTRFKHSTELTLDLMSKLLCYDPLKRITADEALRHPYFSESPPPAHPDSFGSFPSVAAGERRRIASASPDAPERLADAKLAYQLEL